MSILGSFKPNPGSTKSRKRVGRGDGSGHGGTSCKGHKGQKARTGGRVRWGFEGGQTPLMRRLPKFGFSNSDYANRFVVLNLGQVEALGVTEISPELLVKKGWLGQGEKLKVLASGELKKSVKIKAHKFSEAAKVLIEKAGGSAEVVGQ